MVIFQFAMMTTYDCGCDKFPFRIELPWKPCPCFSNRKLLGGMARRAAFGAGTDCSVVNDQVALLVWSMELTVIHRELPSGYLLQFSMEAMALIEIDG